MGFAAMAKADALTELRTALEKKDSEKWVNAITQAQKEGYETDQINEALEETIKEDPVAAAKFMESTYRPPKAMCVINMPDDCEEWESQVHYPEAMFRGALAAAWNTYPRIPYDDPWGDDVDKAHCEVVNREGVVMTINSLASRI